MLSDKPLTLHSEFPRNFLVSMVLMVFSMILILLLSQVINTLLNSSGNSTAYVKTPSMAYLLAYFLANALFLGHLCLYFGYSENITLNENDLVLKRGLFRLRQTIVIPLDNIFYHQNCQSVLGSYHIQVYFHDELGKTKTLKFGNYLDDEYLELLTIRFNRLYHQKTLLR